MKKAFLLASLLWAISAAGQEQLQHQHKIHHAPDGKLHINKALPLYLWVSTSSDVNSDKVRMESVESKAYTNPMYLDTEGMNTVRSPSKVDTVTKLTVYPESDIIFEVYADSRPPVAKHSLGDAKTHKTRDGMYAGGDVEFSVKATDVMSGVDQVYYSKNNSGYVVLNGNLTFSEEQSHTLKYYAVDNVGNVSAVGECNFTIDKTAPRTVLSVRGDSIPNVVSGRSLIVLTAEDGASGVKSIFYKINDGTERRYSAPIPMTNIKEGAQALTYYAIDNVGNKEAEQKYELFVDRTAPMIIDELQGNTYIVNGKEYASGRTKMKLTAIDNKSGVKDIFYSSDGRNFERYTQPFYLPNTTGGQGIVYYATDNVNNKSMSAVDGQKNRMMYMDLSGPKLSNTFIGATFRNRDTVFVNAKTKIVLKSVDAESGSASMTYSINSAPEVEYTEAFAVEKEGRYRITFTGYDMVQNSSTAEFGFIVDTKGPEIFERYSIEPIGHKDGLLSYPSHVVVFLSATDIDAGFSKLSYSLNGAPMQTYSGYVSGFAKNTKYEMLIKASDKLNNTEEKKISFHTAD